MQPNKASVFHLSENPLIRFYLKLHTCKGAYDIFMTGTSRDSDRQVFIYLQK